MIIDVRKQGDIVALKLTSGEEVVGSFQEDANNIIKLRKPLAMAMTQQGPALAPYFATADIMETPEVAFNKDNVVAMMKVHKPFADAYIEATTGLATAAPSSQLQF